MKKLIHSIAAVVIISPFISYSSFGQTKIGNNKNTIGAGSLLELESTDKAFVLPRMTTAQMNAIVNPVEGMQIFNTTDSCISQYNKGGWNSLCEIFNYCLISTLDSGQTDPNNPGTVFTPPGSDQSSCALYIADDESTWEWNGTSYVPSTAKIDVEPWFYSETDKPAKTLTKDIYHLGSVTVGKGNSIGRGKFSIITGSNNVVTDPYSGAFGYQNYDSATYSFIMGSFNTITDKPNGSHFIAGALNKIDGGIGADFIGNRNNIISNGGSSAVFGNGNFSSQPYSFVAGRNNTNNATTAVVLGYGNYNTAANGGILGYADTITTTATNGAWTVGFNNNVSGDRSIALGNNLIVGEGANIVAGRFNEPQTNALFTVGAGSSNTDRQNAIAVLSTAVTGANNSATAIMIVMPYIPVFPSETDALASNLASGSLFRVAGSRVLYLRP